MKFNTLGSIFTFLAVLPTFSDTLPHESRATDGVWICSDKDWKEPCGWVPAWESDTLCRGFPYPLSPYLSVGPDSGVTCTVFTDEHCDTANDGTDSKDVSFPGNPMLPGPAYQGGQGTAHSPAYHAYKFHPRSTKREITPIERMQDLGKSEDTQSNEESKPEKRDSQTGSLSPLATSNPLEARAADGVLICPEAGWKGQCEWTQVGMSPDCRPVPSGWQRWSLGPDIDVTCFLYADTQCKSESYTIRTQTNWPGLDKLAGPAYTIGKRDASVTACKAYACNKREADNPKPNPSNGVHAPNFQVPGANVRAIEARDKGNLYICELPYWQGTCELWSVEATEEIHAPCAAFPYPTSSTAVSFGPDPGVVCKIYMDNECSRGNMSYVPEIIFPGWTDLEKHGSNGGYGWARYKCWQGDDSKVPPLARRS